jgi:hypothetical protein
MPQLSTLAIVPSQIAPIVPTSLLSCLHAIVLMLPTSIVLTPIVEMYPVVLLSLLSHAIIIV